MSTPFGHGMKFDLMSPEESLNNISSATLLASRRQTVMTTGAYSMLAEHSEVDWDDYYTTVVRGVEERSHQEEGYEWNPLCGGGSVNANGDSTSTAGATMGGSQSLTSIVGKTPSCAAGGCLLAIDSSSFPAAGGPLAIDSFLSPCGDSNAPGCLGVHDGSGGARETPQGETPLLKSDSSRQSTSTRKSSLMAVLSSFNPEIGGSISTRCVNSDTDGAEPAAVTPLRHGVASSRLTSDVLRTNDTDIDADVY